MNEQQLVVEGQCQQKPPSVTMVVSADVETQPPPSAPPIIGQEQQQPPPQQLDVPSGVVVAIPIVGTSGVNGQQNPATPRSHNATGYSSVYLNHRNDNIAIGGKPEIYRNSPIDRCSFLLILAQLWSHTPVLLLILVYSDRPGLRGLPK